MKLLIALFFLTGCCALPYQPHYIISEKWDERTSPECIFPADA